jgi:hypothetical protein
VARRSREQNGRGCDDARVIGPDEANDLHEPPRASLIAAAGEFCRPAVYMGGAHTTLGDEVALDGLERAWVIDCAGEMPGPYRERAGRFFARVFPDLDGEVAALPRLRQLAVEVALESRFPEYGAPHGAVYVMCHHGMNRSGLMAGLILRELGVSGEETVRRIVAARPGSLSNQAFRAILLTPRPPLAVSMPETRPAEGTS